MIRSIELMLGLDPMNKFDALSDPMVACFTDEPDLTPYVATKNNVPLDERNPPGKKMTAADRYWLEKTESLDWSHLDAADPYWLNRINWYSIYKGTTTLPRPTGQRPPEKRMPMMMMKFKLRVRFLTQNVGWRRASGEPHQHSEQTALQRRFMVTSWSLSAGRSAELGCRKGFP